MKNSKNTKRKKSARIKADDEFASTFDFLNDDTEEPCAQLKVCEEGEDAQKCTASEYKTHNKAQEYALEKTTLIFEKYKHFFTKHDMGLRDIPVGWIEHLERVFDTFSATGLHIQITKFLSVEGTLRVETKDPPHFRSHFTYVSEKVMNDLLATMSEVCILCGNQTTDKKFLCGSCHEMRGYM